MKSFWRVFTWFMVLLTIVTVVGLVLFHVLRVPMPSWSFNSPKSIPVQVKPLQAIEEKAIANAIVDYYISNQKGIEGYDIIDHISKFTVLENSSIKKKLCVDYTFVHVPDQRVLPSTYGTLASGNFYLENAKGEWIVARLESVDTCPADNNTTVVDPEISLQSTPDEEEIVSMIKKHVDYQINFVKRVDISTNQSVRNYMETCATVVGYSGKPNELLYVLIYKNHKWEVVDGYHRRGC